MSSATSTIEIYKSCKLLKDKNFVLDGSSAGIDYVSSYLGTLTKKTITGFQYIKHALAITIKVDLNQDYFQMKQSANDWNYVKIRNSGLNDRNFYYFVDHFEWASENTAKIYLIMDTINTFKYNTDYNVDKKTLVKRMHKDRFKDISNTKYYVEFVCEKTQNTAQTFVFSNVITQKLQTGQYTIADLEIVAYKTSANATIINSGVNYGFFYVVFSGTIGTITIGLHIKAKALLDIVDFKSEEITPPVYKVSDNKLIANRGTDYAKWKLFYRNLVNAGENFGCFLVPDTPTACLTMDSAGYIQSASLTTGFYYISVYYNDFTIDIIINGAYVTPTLTDNGQRFIQIEKDSSGLNISYVSSSGTTIIATGQVSITASIIGNAFRAFYNATQVNYADLIALYSAPSSANVSIPLTLSTSAKVLSDDIDRTDEKNIKIIDLPYAPHSFEINGSGQYVINSPWFYDTSRQMLKLDNLSTKFSNDIETDLEGIYPKMLKQKNLYTLDGTANRFFTDPKLLHSDFYRYKFVYDNFTKVIPYEQLEFNPRSSYAFRFNFKASRLVTSKFLFTFLDIKRKYSNEDYEDIVIASRNNEEVLYSSQYLNYLRNGYNFDLKAKQRAEETGALGIGLNVLGLVAGVALGATGFGAPVAGATIMASGLGLVNQISNYAKTLAQNEDSIERKLQESKNQAVSVMNNDDLDLFDAYSDNKAKICEYKISERMEKVLDDLFYYGGYSVNEQMIPNVSSRYWFNFLQASLEVSETNNISEECMNDIKERFEQGVTFLHYHNGFDFGQVKENLEVDLVTS